jgi:hypothetical protein
VSRTSEWAHVVLLLAEVVEDVPQARVRVLNVVKVAPQVAVLGKDGVIGLQIQTPLFKLYNLIEWVRLYLRRCPARFDMRASCRSRPLGGLFGSCACQTQDNLKI